MLLPVGKTGADWLPPRAHSCVIPLCNRHSIPGKHTPSRCCELGCWLLAAEQVCHSRCAARARAMEVTASS